MNTEIHDRLIELTRDALTEFYDVESDVETVTAEPWESNDCWLVTVAFWDGSFELEVELKEDATHEDAAAAVAKEVDGWCDAGAACRAEQQAERRAMCI